MTRRLRASLLAGAALMAAGTVLPWAWARSIPWNEVEYVRSFDHGGVLVLAVAVVLAAAALAARPRAAVIAAGLAAVVVVGVAWELPGTLLASGGAWEAGVGIGLDLALLGAFVACCGAAVVVLRAINHAALSAMARRAAR